LPTIRSVETLPTVPTVQAEQLPARRADAIVAAIGADIVAGRLSEGEALPTELRLAERFGVSRTVVREAMARLARVGLVRIRQGAGTVVLDRANWRELDRELLHIRAANGLIGDKARDLLEVRRVIEVEVAGFAALRRGPEHLDRLQRLIDQMEACAADPNAYIDADVAFHGALLDAGDNELLREMMRPVNQLRRIGSLLTATRDDDGARFRMAMDGHRAIFAAIAAADPAASRAAMAAHVAQFEDDLMDAMVSISSARGSTPWEKGSKGATGVEGVAGVEIATESRVLAPTPG
jgi:DNA-binding FadR family transcriptional regulator